MGCPRQCPEDFLKLKDSRLQLVIKRFKITVSNDFFLLPAANLETVPKLS